MNKLLFNSKAFLKRNASTILTCVGGIGVIATAVMSAKSTPKALYLLEKAEEEKGEDLTTFEKVKAAGPVYIPAAITGVTTITCIFGANVLNKRQQAALTSAYALLDNSYKEYKKKVKDIYGEDADLEVRSEIAKDKYSETDIQVDDDKKLFYDEFSGRYFESTTEDVLRAEYKINKQIATNSGAYLNEFYEYLGLEKFDVVNHLGWSQAILSDMYWVNWLEFDHNKITLDDSLECCIISMRYEPVIDFEYY